MSAEIEERLAHLERQGDDLSEVVARQSREIDELTACREALGAWFAAQRVELGSRQIARLERDGQGRPYPLLRMQRDAGG